MKPAVHQYEDKLLELAYGELPASEASAVESHVRTCSRCTEALSEIRAVRSTMGQLPMEPVPDTGLESLFAYADQAARRNAAGPAPVATWWRKLMAPLMAAGALSIIGIVAYQSRDVGEPLATREEIATRQDKLQKESLNAAPVAATAEAPAPAPAAAAQPQGWVESEKKVAEADEKSAKIATKPADVEAPRKMSAGSGGEGLGDMLAKAKQSESKKKAAPKADLDYGEYDAVSNAIPRGGGAKKGRSAESNDDAPMADKSVAAKDMKQEAPAPEPVVVAQQAPGNAGGAMPRAQVQAEPKPSAPPPPALEQQQMAESRTQLGGAGTSNAGSFGLGVGSSYGQQSQRTVMGPPATGGLSERESGYDQAGARREAPAAAAKPAEMRSRVDELLKQARAAKQSRDYETEVRILKDVLEGHATGSARLEALNGICNGLQALGLLEQAAPYCQMLVNEFPSSAVAREWIERQNRIQRPAAKRSKSQQYQFDEESDRRPPAPAEPASAPTQAK